MSELVQGTQNSADTNDGESDLSQAFTVDAGMRRRVTFMRDVTMLGATLDVVMRTPFVSEVLSRGNIYQQEGPNISESYGPSTDEERLVNRLMERVNEVTREIVPIRQSFQFVGIPNDLGKLSDAVIACTNENSFTEECLAMNQSARPISRRALVYRDFSNEPLHPSVIRFYGLKNLSIVDYLNLELAKHELISMVGKEEVDLILVGDQNKYNKIQEGILAAMSNSENPMVLSFSDIEELDQLSSASEEGGNKDVIKDLVVALVYERLVMDHVLPEIIVKSLSSESEFSGLSNTIMDIVNGAS